jgi:hypothetical protein
MKLARHLFNALTAVVLAGAACSPAMAKITRSCDASYFWQTTGGTYSGTFAKFTGKGGCGSIVPNRCRERARDAAMACMPTHWAIRWERRRPEHCLNAQGVHGYNVGLPRCTSTATNTCQSPKNPIKPGDIKTRLEVAVCCAFDKPNSYKKLRCLKNVHVRLQAVARGRNKYCSKTRTLVDDYVIQDCRKVWDTYCAQSPPQPTGC